MRHRLIVSLEPEMAVLSFKAILLPLIPVEFRGEEIEKILQKDDAENVEMLYLPLAYTVDGAVTPEIHESVGDIIGSHIFSPANLPAYLDGITDVFGHDAGEKVDLTFLPNSYGMYYNLLLLAVEPDLFVYEEFRFSWSSLFA